MLMKKMLMILMLTGLMVSCVGKNTAESTKTEDSTAVTVDSVKVDTSAVK